MSNGQAFVAENVKTIGSSGIRRVFEMASKLKNPINLSIGQPDFSVPQNIKRAMVDAVLEDKNGYTDTRGLAALREKISKQLADEFAWTPELFVTCGVSGGLLLTLMSCINPGDEVLMGDPYFVSYKHLVRLVGGVPVPVSLYDDFHLHPERFEAAVTPRTKIVMLCSPSNPTGIVYRDEDVKALAEMARRHGLLVVSDEIYNLLSYDGPSPSVVRHAPERTVLLRGFGKSYAMTGLRLGFAAGPPAVIAQMAKLQQYTFVCAPHPGQIGAIEALDTDVSDLVAQYRAKRDFACSQLQEAFEFVRPQGGFYIFAKVPDRFPSGTALVEEAINRNVLVIPGEAFSERDSHFRISYAVPESTIRMGCEVLRSLAK